MTDQPSDHVAPQGAKAAGGPTAAQSRDLRRKAALKANMARRKAQARGRDRGADEASVDTADPAADDRIPADNDTRNE